MKGLKNFLLVMSIFIMTASVLSAHGKSDIDEVHVENLNSWQEDIDLTHKKAGKYNIMITAKDLGGNVKIEGPYNILLDPNSDLPVCGITNPYPNMRVVGNLNIVGTCVDDDAVEKIELILDGDKENPIIAEGKEFWSYYLNTLNMEEGPHTIQVTGYDINGLAGKPVNLTWQLDRTQPLTKVTDREMGMLVSGNVKFEGVVSDGNGIKELAYSVDNGKTFLPVKISTGKPSCNFSINVDTRKFQDGPNVIWFRAVDNASSVGIYSFLYFIDNTKPDVKIVYPSDTDIMDGKFSVAGFAKDKIGVTSLSWQMGSQGGDIDLIPGNPYWCVNVDTIGNKEKNAKFIIRAVDRVGNVVEVTKTINLNQENDKPIVYNAEPKAGQIFDEKSPLFVRGIAKDDDAVKAVKIQLDNRESIIQETRGVYYAFLANPDELSAGKHRISITAIDENDIEGNPVIVEVESKGLPPALTNPKINRGRDSNPLVNGMEVHPESGSVFEMQASSGIGLKSVHTEITWGRAGKIENTIDLKNAPNHTISLPFTPNGPKGLIKIEVSATDSIDRESKYKAFVFVTNTAVVKANEPEIIFADSRISEEGVIINDKEFPASAFLIGANAIKAELVPSTPFATAKLEGNQIALIAGSAIGSSEEVKIKVTTDKGKTVYSKPLIFKNDNELPEIALADIPEGQLLDGKKGSITVNGVVSCQTGVGDLKYRVLAVKSEIKNAVINTVKADPIPSDLQSVKIARSGAFSLSFDTSEYVPGVYIVELIAESAGGNKAAKAFAFTTIPDVEEVNGKIPPVKAPVITWVDAFDVYAVTSYQGNVDKAFESFARKDMAEGSNPLTFACQSDDGKAPVISKYAANKNPSLKANFALINDETYLSGKNIVIPYAAKDAAKLSVYIDTGAAVSSVNYQITGDPVAGGDLTQNGTAKIIKPGVDNPTRWIAEIPLGNLPSRVNNINVTIKAGSLETVIRGAVTVIREKNEDLLDDQERVYSFADASVTYDEVDSTYVLKEGSKFYFYANVKTPLSPSLVTKAPGLEITIEGNLITLTATQDGKYNDVITRITDRFGDSYQSERLNIAADTKAPEVHIITPELHAWLGKTVRLSGTATDTLGIRRVEYSLDEGQTWQNLRISAGNTGGLGVTFSEDVSIKDFEDGIIKIDIRALDNGGNYSVVRTAAYKDVTPPLVNVIEPLNIDVVNGETLVVFKVTDNAMFAKAEYIAPPSAVNAVKRKQIPLSPLVSTIIGTVEMPMDDSMSFAFTDAAGNTTNHELWDFNIDSQSDLPISEIHLPEELQVLTRDFTISGVIYDDDGDTSIFYKIDDDSYRQIPEMGTSFSIDVPLSSMTDNEHTVSVYAVDINGVKGPVVSRKFRISLEEPKGSVELPTINTSVREKVTISGRASDKNGISKVQVSLDNGNSYNDAIGTTNWSYTVDSRAIPGGTQVVFLKVTDGYGIQALYSSLINIDNDAPVLNLELPLDDSVTTGMVFFSGNTYDNVEITNLYVTIRNLEHSTRAVTKKFKIDRIIGTTLDITDMDNGFYNVELTAKDKAGNTTNVSRNIHLDKNRAPAAVDVLYPLNGEHKNGIFNIYGQATAETPIERLDLYFDNQKFSETTITDCGYFSFRVEPGQLTEGVHKYRVDTILATGKKVSSTEQTITYSPAGPWITIDNFTYGDFAINRPYIRGQAGYSISEEEMLFSKSKEASPAQKAITEAKKVSTVELSFDNGKTFIPLSNSEKWMYRIENQDIAPGFHFLLVRATMKNGETAITRTIIQVDNTSPNIKLIAPSNGGRYNQSLNVSGLSNDDVRLEDVTITLRKGDKSSYEVPSFIQGLYLDFHFMGSTLFDVGAGLTFFDDNVKLQAQWGQFTQAQRDAVSSLFNRDLTNMRYGGDNVFGVKIIANVTSIPFSYFFGHDWEWLYATIALGAQFTWFNQTNSGQTQALSALLLQVEFPKVKLHNVKAFSSFAFYTEGSLWFIPTDVSSTVEIKKMVPQIAVGLRTNIF